MDTKLSEKFAAYLKKEENKKTVAIVLCVIGGIVLLGAGAFIVYKLFFAKEDEYDLYDELDFYYDDDEEAEEEAAQETPEAEAEAEAETAGEE